MGDAAVILALQLPGSVVPVRSFQVHLDLELVPDLVQIYPKHVPWLPAAYSALREGFVFVSDQYSDEALDRTKLYLEWMEPQGLLPDSPLVHTFAVDGDTPLAEIAIFRRRGCRPITDEDRLLCDQLAPHLGCAFRLYQRFGGVQHERLALAEVVNRLQVGVILVDRDRRFVVTNRCADGLVDLGDGFVSREGRLHARNPRDDAVMQKILDDAIVGGRSGSHASNLMAVSRQSGKRAYPVVASSLLNARIGDVAEEAVASVVIGNPDAGHAFTPEVLQSLYELTPAESELLGMLADGKSLTDAADTRGVTLNTVRSQLKQVFAKTDTNRQAQLIRLVLTGASEFQEGRES
jgi:DNA-binding CsgD family transcriptional regulator